MSRILFTPTWRDFWNQVYAECVDCENLPFTWRQWQTVEMWFGEEWGVVMPHWPQIGIELRLSFLHPSTREVLLGVGQEQADEMLRKCRRENLNYGRLPLFCETQEDYRLCLNFVKRILSPMKECGENGKAAILLWNATESES
jgi:hypothetical protein